MAEKIKKIASPFAPGVRQVENKPQKDFDTEYKSIQIVDKVVKTGNGDDDFIIKKVVIEDYKPIKEVIDADADSVGVYNIIKQVMRTGDTSLLPQDDGKCNVDFVDAPENLMEVKAMGEAAEKAFNSLPTDLVQDLDLTKFVETMSQEKFDAFIAALQSRAEKKEGEN